MMSLVQAVQYMLTLNHTDTAISRETAHDLIKPAPGWHRFVDLMYDFCDHVGYIVITGMTLERGRLKFTGYGQRHPEHDYVKRIAYTIAGDSCKVCMISGGFGIRRKAVEGWPCLSTPVFVQYCNDCAELYNNTENQ